MDVEKLTTLKTATRYLGFLLAVVVVANVGAVGFAGFPLIAVIVMVLLSDVEWLVGNIGCRSIGQTCVRLFINKRCAMSQRENNREKKENSTAKSKGL